MAGRFRSPRRETSPRPPPKHTSTNPWCNERTSRGRVPVAREGAAGSSATRCAARPRIRCRVDAGEPPRCSTRVRGSRSRRSGEADACPAGYHSTRAHNRVSRAQIGVIGPLPTALTDEMLPKFLTPGRRPTILRGPIAHSSRWAFAISHAFDWGKFRYRTLRRGPTRTRLILKRTSTHLNSTHLNSPQLTSTQPQED